MAAWYEVVLESKYQGQTCINRWTYTTTSSVGTINRSTALALAFVAPQAGTGIFQSDGVMASIRDLVSEQLEFVQLTVLNFIDVTDFYQYVFVNKTGATPGEPMSPALAYGFRSTVVRRDIRRAFKRIAGASETYVGPGGVLANGADIAVNAVANKFGQSLSYNDEGNNIVFVPCVIKRQRYSTATGLPSATGDAYRIPKDESYLQANTATGITWQAYRHIRTQNSRQYGAGE